VVAISQGGQGGITAAPAVRQIYDGIWGLNGDPTKPHDQFAAQGPAFATGAPPTALPAAPTAQPTPGQPTAGLSGPAVAATPASIVLRPDLVLSGALPDAVAIAVRSKSRSARR
jgi:penicillin-binding protein 2